MAAGESRRSHPELTTRLLPQDPMRRGCRQYLCELAFAARCCRAVVLAACHFHLSRAICFDRQQIALARFVRDT